MPSAKLPPIILAEILLREWELHAARPTLPEHRPALLGFVDDVQVLRRYMMGA